ncbi:MAG TPA: glycolate oxidase subunit GlcE [Burkholderiaceae bacterium]|nr:glycolate oxidase subunit GlcE [Burkholderiaceae bacterium]
MEFVLSEMIDQVMTARASQKALYIQGGGTKRFYGEPMQDIGAGSLLDVSAYRGVINYQPSELVISARAGTPLSEIESLLAEHRQMLAFEPPRFGPSSTLGGCVAAGLSGPRRMMAGSLRDFVLGATLLDASGTLLRFGGEVMKNVAGYDVARLLTGSMGIFGPILEVSLKVAPCPLAELTLELELDEAAALDRFKDWRSKPLPISATAWLEQEERGRLRVRLSGSDPALASARRFIGGEVLEPDAAAQFWDSVRDQTHPFFRALPLWRLSVPPSSPPLGLGSVLIEWNGGQRWLADGPIEPDFVRKAAARHGGHATLFRYAEPPVVPVLHPLPAGVRAISERLKHEFDPTGMFNPGRLFREF